MATPTTTTLTKEQQEQIAAGIAAGLAKVNGQAATPDPLAALRAEIEALKAENARLAAAKAQGVLNLKVSEKGAVSLYGVNTKLPVTMYAEQWERVLSHGPAIRAFIAANKSRLSYKAAK